MKLRWPPVYWTLWSLVRIRSRECTYVCVTFSLLSVILRVYRILQFVKFVMDDTFVQITAWVFCKIIPRVDWMARLGRNILRIEPEVPFLSHSNSIIYNLLWEADSDLNIQEGPCFHGFRTSLPSPQNPTL
jgi:hypothetical protein